jgi:hypothetical protein
VAFVASTVSVEDSPTFIEAGLALILTVGAVAEGVTVTTTFALVVPPLPAAVAVYVVVAAGVTDCVPPIAAIL